MNDRFDNHSANDSGVPDAVTGKHLGFEDGDFDLSVDFYGDGPVSNHLEHISKSRVKKYLKCERKFGFTYLAGERVDSNFYMDRGTAVHEAYENFHHNATAFIAANREFPSNFTELMPPASDWYQFTEFIGPFFRWELDRWKTAKEYAGGVDAGLDLWMPHSMEKSLQLEDPPVGELPWMGPTDLVLHAGSVPMVEANHGLVVTDYKTGSVPDKQYRLESIRIDLAFYSWVWEEHGYDVVGSVGMYPGESGTIVREGIDHAAREKITEVVEDLHSKAATREEFPIKPQALCSWCDYQNQCNTPQNKDPEDFPGH